MKSIVKYFASTFELDKINWAFQMKLAKSLLSKYSREEVVYAIDYFKNKGTEVHSLGFLSWGMKEALTAMKAEEYESNLEGDANERNKRKIRTNYEAISREKYYLDLLTEPNEDS